MVKVVDGGAWRGSLLFALLGAAAVANGCGGRTVWVEEGADAGESGDGGASGRGGSYSGGDAGAYGGDGYNGGYGGTSGGVYTGGAYGGGGYTGGYGGDYGGAYTGGYGGTYGGAGYTGGVAGKGGYGGTYGGSAGVAGKGGCGAASGTGGSSGSPALGKACSLFCTRFPYSTCDSDLDGPLDCLEQCQDGFGLGSWCEFALSNFLICTGQRLNPAAMCNMQNGDCSGPGCLSDAVNACATEYLELLECQESPRPVPPCPPPPNPPFSPNCRQDSAAGPDYCVRETSCPNVTQLTECSYLYDGTGSWYCYCYSNGVYYSSANTTSGPSDACQEGAARCGFY